MTQRELFHQKTKFLDLAIKLSNFVFSSFERLGTGFFEFASASSKRSAASPYNTGMDLIANAIVFIF